MATRATVGTKDTCRHCDAKITFGRLPREAFATVEEYQRSIHRWWHLYQPVTDLLTCAGQDDIARWRTYATPKNYCPQRQDNSGDLCNRKVREGRGHCGIHDRAVREQEERDARWKEQWALQDEFNKIMESLIDRLKALGLTAEIHNDRWGGGVDGRVIIDGVELLELLEEELPTPTKENSNA